MSFIHTLASEETCLIVADTLISPFQGVPPNFGDLSSHRLKVHVIDHDHAIAFAGSTAGAKIIESYYQSGQYGHKEFEIQFEQYCSQNTGTNPSDVDFLLFKQSAGSHGIWKFDGGKASLVSTAYIGNSEFYKEMVTLRSSLNLRDKDDYYRNMHEKWLEHFETHQATTELISKRRFNDVGTAGLPPIRIVKTRKEGFRIMDAAMKVTGIQQYSIVSVFSDNYPISLGYYFDAIDKGIVFTSGVADPTTVCARTLDEFVATANRELNLDLKKRVH